MALRPLGKSFLFEFTNETSGGRFIERNSGSIILTNQDILNQGTVARWGKVIAIGDDVVEFDVGDYVLIEALKWTTVVEFEGRKYWKSDEEKVLAIGADESVTFAF